MEVVVTDSCPVLEPSQKQLVEILNRAEGALAAMVSSALDGAVKQAAEDLRAIGRQDAAPALQYFASVVHQRMYCIMCGADPDTLQGGDPVIASHIIRNCENIANRYWLEDEAPRESFEIST